MKISQDLINNEDTSEKIVSTEQSMLWCEERFNTLASELKELHPELSYDYLKDGVYEQLIDNNGSNSNMNKAFRRGGWQGLTVAQASVAIDTALNYLSLGSFLAKWWGSRDRYQNNGRINL